MRWQRVKRLLELAKQIDATLELSYSGSGFVDYDAGFLQVTHTFQVVDPDERDGGWEYYSERYARRLSKPKFIMPDGSTIGLSAAIAKAREKVAHEQA